MRGADKAGRRTCVTHSGNKVPTEASGTGGGTEALHRVQCSQAFPGACSGLLGVWSVRTKDCALLRQMTDDGSPVLTGVTLSRTPCSATA